MEYGESLGQRLADLIIALPLTLLDDQGPGWTSVS